MASALLIISSGLGVCIWILVALIPWRPWSTRERFAVTNRPQSLDLSSVTVLIPARNEKDTIGQTIGSLNQQGSGLRVVLVDDQSDDGTAEAARSAASQIDLKIITGTALPKGWAGKLWALQQGLQHIETTHVLLLDADIELRPHVIPHLLNKMTSENLDLVSIMAHLRMKTFYEKLLIPAFIYFFKFMYPFALGNSAQSKMGVAAGGFILVKKEALVKIEAFDSIRGALIDDCTLAQKFKSSGYRTWIGLSRDVLSHRGYDDLKEIWNMVARSAFTQLNYSNLFLIACTVVMFSMYLAPWICFVTTRSEDILFFSAIGIGIMTALYIPTLLFYSLSPVWAVAMPIIALMYLAMTWTSAIRYWRGKKSEWKNRVYASN